MRYTAEWHLMKLVIVVQCLIPSQMSMKLGIFCGTSKHFYSIRACQPCTTVTVCVQQYETTASRASIVHWMGGHCHNVLNDRRSCVWAQAKCQPWQWVYTLHRFSGMMFIYGSDDSWTTSGQQCRLASYETKSNSEHQYHWSLVAFRDEKRTNHNWDGQDKYLFLCSIMISQPIPVGCHRVIFAEWTANCPAHPHSNTWW